MFKLKYSTPLLKQENIELLRKISTPIAHTEQELKKW